MPTVKSSYTFEVELGLTAHVIPAAPEQGPTYDCGGQPAEPTMVEDIDIESIGFVRAVRRGVSLHTAWETVDLLDGIDRTSDAYKRLVQNILSLIGEGAEDAILSEPF